MIVIFRAIDLSNIAELIFGNTLRFFKVKECSFEYICSFLLHWLTCASIIDLGDAMLKRMYCTSISETPAS